MNIKKRTGKLILWAFMLTALLEITLFNFRHWESFLFPKLAQPQLTLGEGIEKIGEYEYQITDPDQAYVNLDGVSGHYKNLYLNIRSESGLTTNVSLTADDAANCMGLNLGDETIISTIPRSSYLRLHLSGTSNYIRIKLNESEGFCFQLETPVINTVVPMNLSWLRVIMVFVILIVCKIFLPGGALVYSESMRLDTTWKKVGLAVFVGLHIVLILIISQLIEPNRTVPENTDWPAYSQYNELTDALLKGQVYLEREAPKSLANASNPYDGGDRWEAVVVNGNEHFDYDYAYFEEKYYCYFGPVPALLFFIPYQLITGTACKTWNVVTFCTLLFCIASFGFIYALGRRYFQKLSYGMFLLMSSFYFWGSGTLYLVYLGIVYSLPIISALLFGTFGLTLWILARKDGKLRKGYLFAGALSIALIIGCRPQLAIILFLAFPIFWKEIVEERVFFSKKGLVNTMMVIVPFLIIGFAMMGYNYARFHSPFDFGANYNLTSNDMTHRGFVFDRFFLGIFCYLLEPINLTAKFPFMHAVSTANDYLGFTSAEPMFGGFFIMNNLALASLFVFKMKKKLKEHKVYAFTVSCLAMGMIIMLCDIQMSGITQRYMSDFGGLIVLSAVMILFLLEEIAHAYKLQHVFCRAVAMLTCLGIFLNFLTILIPERYYSLVSTRQTLFYMLKYMMPFE